MLYVATRGTRDAVVYVIVVVLSASDGGTLPYDSDGVVSGPAWVHSEVAAGRGRSYSGMQGLIRFLAGKHCMRGISKLVK